MNVLTICKGNQADDFCHGILGELAAHPPQFGTCTTPGCGCDRAFTGLNSHKASTTVLVDDRELTTADVVAACRAYLTAAGWERLLADPDGAAAEMAADMLDVAADFPAGTVLRCQLTDELWEFEEASA